MAMPTSGPLHGRSLLLGRGFSKQLPGLVPQFIQTCVSFSAFGESFFGPIYGESSSRLSQLTSHWLYFSSVYPIPWCGIHTLCASAYVCGVTLPPHPRQVRQLRTWPVSHGFAPQYQTVSDTQGSQCLLK